MKNILLLILIAAIAAAGAAAVFGPRYLGQQEQEQQLERDASNRCKNYRALVNNSPYDDDAADALTMREFKKGGCTSIH
jgi:Flp pilus assembly protein CpaB